MAMYVEINLKKGDNEIEHNKLDISQVEEFCKCMKPNVKPEDIYCIERINSDKFVHVIIKYGDIEEEKSKSFCLDRYRSGKVCMLENLRRKVAV